MAVHEISDLVASFNGADTPECTNNDTKCVGYDLYKCIDGSWVLWAKNSTECGYVPNGPEPENDILEWIKKNALWLGIGGAGIAAGVLAWPKKKTKGKGG